MASREVLKLKKSLFSIGGAILVKLFCCLIGYTAKLATSKVQYLSTFQLPGFFGVWPFLTLFFWLFCGFMVEGWKGRRCISLTSTIIFEIHAQILIRLSDIVKLFQ